MDNYNEMSAQIANLYNKMNDVEFKIDMLNSRLCRLDEIDMKLNAIIKKSNRVYDKQSVYNQPIVEAVPASNTTTDEPPLTPEQLFAMLREIEESPEFAECAKNMKEPPVSEFQSDVPEEPKGEDH